MFVFLGLRSRRPEPRLWCSHPRGFGVRDVEGGGRRAWKGGPSRNGQLKCLSDFSVTSLSSLSYFHRFRASSTSSRCVIEGGLHRLPLRSHAWWVRSSPIPNLWWWLIINSNPLDLESIFLLTVSLLKIVSFILTDPEWWRGGHIIIFTLWMAMTKKFLLQYLFLCGTVLGTT